MKVSHKSILEALKKVVEPDLGKDIVSLGLVSELKYSKENISFSVQKSLKQLKVYCQILKIPLPLFLEREV